MKHFYKKTFWLSFIGTFFLTSYMWSQHDHDHEIDEHAGHDHQPHDAIHSHDEHDHSHETHAHVAHEIEIDEHEHADVHLHSEDEHTESISFLKEQQWNVDFEVKPTSLRSISRSIPAYGVVQIPNSGRVMLSAPVDGIVSISDDTDEIEAGCEFKKGQSVFKLKPTASWFEGLASLRKEYLSAKIELKKLEKLYEKQAVSEERIGLTKINVQTLKQSLLSIGGSPDLNMNSPLLAQINAPLSGVLTEVFVVAGQHVQAGDRLAMLVNDNHIVIEVNVPTSRIESLMSIRDVVLIPTGKDEVYRLNDFEGRVLSQKLLKSNTPGISLIRFWMVNPHQQLSEGAQLSVQLLSSEKSNRELCVKRSAIFEESGMSVVYVQTSGESFEKRSIKTGVSDGQYVEVLRGLNEGDRVVTKGGALVRLAALTTTEMGHGHAH